MKYRFKISKKIILLFSLCAITFLSVTLYSSRESRFQPEFDSALFGPPLPRYIFRDNNDSINPELMTLGRELYYDKRLSKHDRISCNTCHRLEDYGVDNKPHPFGNRRNTPTVYYAAANIAQNWDGKYLDVEEQAKAAILNKKQMGMPSEESVVAILNSIPGYVRAFQKAFPEESNPITLDNIGKAIGAFERGLVPLSAFDYYFSGSKVALNARQKRGLKLFIDVGCATCHSGTYFGGQMFRKVGLYQPWPNQEDRGRYELTKKYSDLMSFKVSSLRNVAKTAPYYHDGSVKTLEEAVKIMAWNQSGKKLSPDRVRDIVAFLESLTGAIPTDYIAKPHLPHLSSDIKIIK